MHTINRKQFAAFDNAGPTVWYCYLGWVIRCCDWIFRKNNQWFPFMPLTSQYMEQYIEFRAICVFSHMVEWNLLIGSFQIRSHILLPFIFFPLTHSLALFPIPNSINLAWHVFGFLQSSFSSAIIAIFAKHTQRAYDEFSNDSTCNGFVIHIFLGNHWAICLSQFNYSIWCDYHFDFTRILWLQHSNHFHCTGVLSLSLSPSSLSSRIHSNICHWLGLYLTWK